MNLTLQRIEHATDDARQLVGELENEMAATYSNEQRHGLSVERIFQPHVMFFIAYLNGEPAGCGGIAFDDGFAELKRMYVRPALRGRGIVQGLLDRLAAEALARGYRRVTLETGDVQHAAMRAYERAGFTRCAAFGDYCGLPREAVERSVFFEKQIV